MPTKKTGLAESGAKLHKVALLIAKFPAKLPAAIDDAVTAGTITASEGTQLKTFLGEVPANANIARKASGY